MRTHAASVRTEGAGEDQSNDASVDATVVHFAVCAAQCGVGEFRVNVALVKEQVDECFFFGLAGSVRATKDPGAGTATARAGATFHPTGPRRGKRSRRERGADPVAQGETRGRHAAATGRPGTGAAAARAAPIHHGTARNVRRREHRDGTRRRRILSVQQQRASFACAAACFQLVAAGADHHGDAAGAIRRIR